MSHRIKESARGAAEGGGGGCDARLYPPVELEPARLGRPNPDDGARADGELPLVHQLEEEVRRREAGGGNVVDQAATRGAEGGTALGGASVAGARAHGNAFGHASACGVARPRGDRGRGVERGRRGRGVEGQGACVRVDRRTGAAARSQGMTAPRLLRDAPHTPHPAASKSGALFGKWPAAIRARHSSLFGQLTCPPQEEAARPEVSWSV